jgi:hypothetical protein
MGEFERVVESQVEREFARAFKALQAGEACEIPIIGDPFPPPQYRDGLKERAAWALRARKWFEFEAPLWAQPLPLKRDDCHALFNQPNRRLRPVGQYGIALRSMGWEYKRAIPFERYCAQVL